MDNNNNLGVVSESTTSSRPLQLTENDHPHLQQPSYLFTTPAAYNGSTLSSYYDNGIEGVDGGNRGLAINGNAREYYNGGVGIPQDNGSGVCGIPDKFFIPPARHGSPPPLFLYVNNQEHQQQRRRNPYEDIEEDDSMGVEMNTTTEYSIGADTTLKGAGGGGFIPPAATISHIVNGGGELFSARLHTLQTLQSLHHQASGFNDTPSLNFGTEEAPQTLQNVVASSAHNHHHHDIQSSAAGPSVQSSHLHGVTTANGGFNGDLNDDYHNAIIPNNNNNDFNPQQFNYDTAAPPSLTNVTYRVVDGNSIIPNGVLSSSRVDEDNDHQHHYRPSKFVGDSAVNGLGTSYYPSYQQANVDNNNYEIDELPPPPYIPFPSGPIKNSDGLGSCSFDDSPATIITSNNTNTVSREFSTNTKISTEMSTAGVEETEGERTTTICSGKSLPPTPDINSETSDSVSDSELLVSSSPHHQSASSSITTDSIISEEKQLLPPPKHEHPISTEIADDSTKMVTASATAVEEDFPSLGSVSRPTPPIGSTSLFANPIFGPSSHYAAETPQLVMVVTTSDNQGTGMETFNLENGGLKRTTAVPHAAPPSHSISSKLSSSSYTQSGHQHTFLPPTPVSQPAVKSSNLTQVVIIPFHERRFKPSKGHLGDYQLSEQNSICSEIINKTGAHLELQQNNMENSLTVLITGKNKVVEEARKLVIQQLQAQSHTIIEVPKEYHSAILGRAGERVRKIESDCGVKIHLPNRNLPSNLIRIEGAKEGITRAQELIQTIFQERAKNHSQKTTIETEYLPLIRGADSDWFRTTEQQTGVRIRILPSQPNSPTTTDILVTGLREQVEQVVNCIEALYQEKKLSCTKFEYRIDHKKHKYISGRPRNSFIQHIFKETGVLVLLPPSPHPLLSQSANNNDPNISSSIQPPPPPLTYDRDLVVLFGPKKCHGLALTMVLEKADSMIEERIEIPRWIHKHLVKSEMIKNIQDTSPNVHLEFGKDNSIPDLITIEGPPDQVQRTIFNIRNLVKNIKERVKLQEIPVDSSVHSFIIGKGGITVNRIKDVSHVENIKIPGDKGPNFVQIEGSPDSISIAIREILEIVDRRENESSIDIEIEAKYMPLLIGPNGDKIRELRNRFVGQEIVISILSAASNGGGTSNNPSKKRTPTNPPSTSSNRIHVRGTKHAVQACTAYIEELKKHFAQYTFGEAPYPVGYFDCHVISHVRYRRHLRTLYPDIEFKFSQKDAAAATGESTKSSSSSRAQSLSSSTSIAKTNDYSDDREITLTKQQRKNKKALAQPGGNSSLPNNAQQSIPITNTITTTTTTLPTPNNPSSVAAETNHSTNQTFTLRINPTGTQSAVTTITATLDPPPPPNSSQHLIKHFLKTYPDGLTEIRLPRTQGGSITSLSYAERLRITEHCENNFETFVRFPGAKNEAVEFDQLDIITIIGKRGTNIEKTRNYLKKFFTEIGSRITISLNVKASYCPLILGSKGSRLSKICSDANVKIQIPDLRTPKNSVDDQGKGDDNDNAAASAQQLTTCDITITGLPDNCERAKQEILDILPYTDTMKLGKSIWDKLNSSRGGLKPKFKSVTFKITNFLDDQNDDSDEKSLQLQMTGPRRDVESAKTFIQEKTDDASQKAEKLAKAIVETIEVPNRFKGRLIGQRGSEIGVLCAKHGVRIQIPPNHTKSSKDFKGGDNVEGDTTGISDIDLLTSLITISGESSEAVQAALQELEEKIQKLEMNDSLRVEIPTNLIPRFIGTQGRVIKQLMADFEVDINTRFVSRNNGGGIQGYTPPPGTSVLTITGQLDNILRARDHIINLRNKYEIQGETAASSHPNGPKSDRSTYNTTGKTNSRTTHGTPFSSSQTHVNGYYGDDVSPTQTIDYNSYLLTPSSTSTSTK